MRCIKLLNAGPCLALVGAMALAQAVLVPQAAYSHGGGGGHGGGSRGGGGARPGGGAGAGSVAGRGLDGGVAGRGLDGGVAGRGLDGGVAGRGLDGGVAGRGLDGGVAGRGLDGVRATDGVGHFAGDAGIGHADLARIANQSVARGAVGRNAVRPYSNANLASRGNLVRSNFYRGGWYGGRGWYGAHFNQWWPGRWYGGFGWGLGAGLLWADLASWGGYGTTPVAYDYGSTICYQDDGVYVQGSRVGTAEEYADQAALLAAQGAADKKVPADDDEWRPLGVFALARSEETDPNAFMSLALDKEGLVRGSYYDAVSDTSQNITGKVDKKTQRAAWTIGDKKTPLYDAGLSNLAQQQTMILVHREGGKVEQMLLVRVEDDAAKDGVGKDAGDKDNEKSPAAGARVKATPSTDPVPHE